MSVEPYLGFFDQSDLTFKILVSFFFVTVGSSRMFIRGLGLGLDVRHDDWFDDEYVDVMWKILVLYRDVIIMMLALKLFFDRHADASWRGSLRKG